MSVCHSEPAFTPVIAVTAGEPAGIGPDLVLLLAGKVAAARLIVVADLGLLEQRARQLGMARRFRAAGADAQTAERTDSIEVMHVPLARPSKPGILDQANSAYVLATLDHALEGCRSGRYHAMVTAPVHKGIICAAGFPFTGHTEYLASRTGCDQVVMMLSGGGMRVALATTHLPLRAVAAALTQSSLERTLRILDHDLRVRFALEMPRILVSGLNPHAGESGHLGREEIEVIEPVLQKLRQEGLRLTGPLPADTLFQPKYLEQADCVLAMYHDQGLAVLKYASFGKGVNVTLGLPIIRTSVDHGTAVDLAGSGQADPRSLLEAIDLAVHMARRAQCRVRDHAAAQLE